MPGRPRGPRVIAGEAGGRRLTVPRSGDLRPTSDRVKESLFAALGAPRIVGVAVLDLFAGTGALGIEALSRGAARAVLVDQHAATVAAVTVNLDLTGMADRGRALRREVGAFLRGAPPGEAPFDLVFLDPPYDLPDTALAAVLGGLTPAWVGTEATVVVERASANGSPPWPPGWVSTWERCYGDTLLCFGRTSEETG